jgi:nitrogen fixation protein FixH
MEQAMCCCGVFIMPVELSGAGTSHAPAPERHRTFTLKGWHALAMFVGFFGIVAAANAVMLTAALRTMPGLDARNGYDPSQRYNAEIRTAQEQAERGWRAEAQLSLSEGAAVLVVKLSDREGLPLSGLHAQAVLRHPSDSRRDRSITLTSAADGRYAARLPETTPGAWDLVIEVKREAGAAPSFASRQRVVLKG